MKKTSVFLRFFGFCFLVGTAFFLNFETGYGQTSTETVLFSSTDVSQWTVDGRVTYQPSDTTLRFVFGFDADNPPKSRPDTTTLEIVPEFDLAGCDSVFFSLYDLRFPAKRRFVDSRSRERLCETRISIAMDGSV